MATTVTTTATRTAKKDHTDHVVEKEEGVASNNSSTTTNPYLALREANIARNQARLDELGLLKHQRASTKKARTAKSTKRQLPPQTTRRSRRLQQEPAPPPLDLHDDEDVPTKKRKRKPRSSSTKLTITSKKKEAAINPHSARAISLQLSTVVSAFLGVSMNTFGKQHVMDEICAHGQNGSNDAPIRVSFNKYSGMQEWQNAAFLWVNLTGTGDDSLDSNLNTFLRGGKQITWFGGSRIVDDSHPQLQTLFRYGGAAGTQQVKDVEEKEKDSVQKQEEEPDKWLPNSEMKPNDSRILLWVRTPADTNHKLTPYVCLGRLGYASHQPDSYPLAVVWNLLDYDDLLRPDPSIRRAGFQRMVAQNSSNNGKKKA